MKENRILCFGIRLGLLLPYIACSPTKGYEGPTRPSSDVAFVIPAEVTSSITEGQKFSADGTQFTLKGISLLPGSHTLTLASRRISEKSDCVPSERVDTNGYDGCPRNTVRPRWSSVKYYPDCPLGNFTSITYYCMASLLDLECSLTALVEAGRTYELRVLDNKIELYLQGQNSVIGEAACNETSHNRERMSFTSPN